MAFSPPEYCRLFAQKKAYQGGVTGTPGPPLATPLNRKGPKNCQMLEKKESIPIQNTQDLLVGTLSIGIPSILCIFMTSKRGTSTSLLTATRKLENIFRQWAGLDAGCWWFISLLWSSWVLSTENHLFFEMSTRLLPDGLPLTLGAVLMCTELRWCACTRSSCWS